MSMLSDFIKKFHELADHPDTFLKRNSNISAVLTSCDELRTAARLLEQMSFALGNAVDFEYDFEGLAKIKPGTLKLLQTQAPIPLPVTKYVPRDFLIELRPTAFEQVPHFIDLLKKVFNKSDRMLVTLAKVPETGDVMQIDNLDIEAMQVILKVSPMHGHAVAVVYVKVHA